MKSMSIKWKIFLFLIGFCSLLLLILWLLQVVFLDSFYKNIKISEIKDSASSIVKNIDDENLEELVDRISTSNDVNIEIFWEDGRVIKSSDRKGDDIAYKMPVLEKAQILVKTRENGGELLQYYDSNSLRVKFNGNRMMFKAPLRNPGLQQSIIYSKIMSDRDNNTVVLLLNSVISPVNATVRTLRRQLYYITGIMVLFSVILAFIISRRVSDPIEKVNESAKILAQGNYDITFSGSGYREIDELSNTLNYTAKELSKVEGLRKELIANISHDLRTPLTLISGYAEAMCDIPGEMSLENAQIIVDETKRLTTLVNDVLDISKLESGVLSINPAIYNLTYSIRDTINRINELVKNEGYIIDFIFDEEVKVNADETKISQALYNLLINAINYTGEDKRVTVKQTVSSSSVKIEVIDTGTGIEEKYYPYIWDRYFKVDKTHRRGVTGTGLGLSIVKSIIELHEGEYGVSSNLGMGSVFWFTLKI